MMGGVPTARRGERHVPGVKRILGALVSAYLLLALATRVAEGLGARKCGCAQDCWCRRPLLSAFRWVLPWPHRSAPAPSGRETQ